ncbi:Pkinase-domain-containing protein [Daedalea quercina L-15889]|uniref:Pkinase-domain-containing protein n=1 Tax=Daedalea quercina L-15889 TaxID=1314783 RepID=A0A165U4M3_9APHY|nr:Pkinase-domain-containing protein [Daedalea quercina L-15889]
MQDSSSSRSRRDTDDRLSGDPQSSQGRQGLSAKDGPRGRDEHDRDAPYNGSGRAYGYDQNHSTPSRQESSSWTPRYDRSGGHGERPEDDVHSQQSERGRGRYGEDRRDSGWPRRDGGGTERRRSPRDESIPREDRAWEPSASWKPAGRGDQPQRQNNSKRTPRNKNGKGKKNKQQKRDWRADDSQLNNWTRRDSGPSNKQNNRPGGKRKHRRSPSRGRSRSPADSYYSRRSSRGRSPSYDTGRRRHRFDSPVGRSPSPSARRGKRNGNALRRRSRSPSWSPPSPDSRGRSSPHYSPSGRRTRGRTRSRSVSPSLSGSRSRSPSSSPRQRSRTVHRLPTSTRPDLSEAAKARLLRDSSTPRVRRWGPVGPRSPSPPYQRRRGDDKRQDRDARSSDMPPPSTTISGTADAHDRRSSSPGEPRKVSAPQPISTKKAGFRPIGQASSALKRFFPGDDEDETEAAPERQSGSAAVSSAARFVSLSSQKPPSQNGRVASRVSTDEEVSKAPGGVSNGRAIDHPDAQEPSSRDISLRPSNIGEDVAISHREQDLNTPGITRPPTPVRYGVYDCLNQVGEGTFGQVWKARNTSTGIVVALKKIRMEAERDGFPVTAMREIKLLQSLRHENVVSLYEMMVSNGSVFMVFEYMDHDLTGILSQTQFTFTDAHLKSFCQQMLAGLAYLHRKGVIHRDIKGSNILINNAGVLKLADFGLARFYQKRRRSDYTNRVITLWYRPPELLFGTTVYGSEVDMWSAGCIMLELFTKKPVFQGNDEIHQLDVIYRIVGTPVVEQWPGMTSLPWYELVKPKEFVPNHFRQLFEKWLSPAGLDLAERLLTYDPAKRVTAVEALEAPYFKEEQPRPSAPASLHTMEGEWHEFEAKRERARKRRRVDG